MLTRSLFYAALVALLSASAITAGPSPLPKGFARAKGSKFEIDGKPFAFVGANSYWIGLLTTQEDVELSFKEMKNAGVKVLRTWGFNAINQTELADAKKSGLTYYQVWNNGDWTLNDGPQGLQRLDKVVKTAEKYGIKLILAFTNNWVGYGGSELYINHLVGSGVLHDVFYTDPKIIRSYQRYVKTIVNRYKNSPTIFAWELMNEARCLGDLPSGPACPASGMISTWYENQAAFVKKLDPYHMVTTGGEGQFFWKNPADPSLKNDYNYNGQAGEDFDHDLSLKDIDFGTYHLYPQYWYGGVDHPGTGFSIKDWGLKWIQEHADAAKKLNKPVILEEFSTFGLQNKTEIYPEWVGLALKTGHAGIMPWQFGVLGLTENGGNRLIKYADAIIDGASPNDGHTYYKNQTAVWKVFTDAAKVQASRSG